MNHLFLPLVCACLFGVVHSVWELADSWIQSAGERFEDTTTSAAALHLGLTPEEHSKQAENFWRSVVAISGSVDERPNYQLGRLLRKQLPQVPENDRLAVACETISTLRRALAKSPHQPTLHLAVAEAETQLPTWRKRCSKFLSTIPGDGLNPPARLDWMHRLAPYSLREQYLAVGLHLALGQKKQALELLRENQELNPHFTEEQRRFAFSLVSSPEELGAAIPRRYPEVLWWERHFRTERRNDFLRWESVFRRAFADAVDDLITRLRTNQLPQPLFSRSIKAIRAAELCDRDLDLSRRLDQLLAALYADEGSPLWSNVVQQRSELIRLPVLKALLNEDYTPGSGMFFGWLPDLEQRTATFDLPGRSLGFYRPENYVPELLILQGGLADGSLDPRRIKFYGSPDNERFHPIALEELVTAHVIDGQLRFAYRIPETEFRYFKIHFSGTSSRGRFSNAMRHLVQVYGRKKS